MNTSANTQICDHRIFKNIKCNFIFFLPWIFLIWILVDSSRYEGYFTGPYQYNSISSIYNWINLCVWKGKWQRLNVYSFCTLSSSIHGSLLVLIKTIPLKKFMIFKYIFTIILKVWQNSNTTIYVILPTSQ